jgi:hypothetical protein
MGKHDTTRASPRTSCGRTPSPHDTVGLVGAVLDAIDDLEIAARLAARASR